MILLQVLQQYHLNLHLINHLLNLHSSQPIVTMSRHHHIHYLQYFRVNSYYNNYSLLYWIFYFTNNSSYSKTDAVNAPIQNDNLHAKSVNPLQKSLISYNDDDDDDMILMMMILMIKLMIVILMMVMMMVMMMMLMMMMMMMMMMIMLRITSSASFTFLHNILFFRFPLCVQFLFKFKFIHFSSLNVQCKCTT